MPITNAAPQLPEICPKKTWGSPRGFGALAVSPSSGLKPEQFLFPQTVAQTDTVHVVWSTPSKPVGQWLLVNAVMPRESAPRNVSLIVLTTAHLSEFVVAVARAAQRGNVAVIVATKAVAIERASVWFEELSDKPSDLAVGLGLLVEYIRSIEMVVHLMLSAGGQRGTAGSGGTIDVARLSLATGGPVTRTLHTPHCAFAPLKQPYGGRRLPGGETAFPEEIANIFRTTVVAMAQQQAATISELRRHIEDEGFSLDELILGSL